MIVIPAAKTPNHGLFIRRGHRYCRWTEGGKMVSCRVDDDSITLARDQRDNIYASLELGGAVRASSAAMAKKSRTRFIQFVPPYRVDVKGHYVGNFLTEEEAIAARDKYLETL